MSTSNETDQNYARGYRRIQDGLRITLGGTTYFPRTQDERSRLLNYIGDGARPYCVEVPAGIMLAAIAGDADGHAVILTGVATETVDERLF